MLYFGISTEMEGMQLTDGGFADFKNDPTARFETIDLSAGNQSDVELYVDHFKLESFFYQVFGTDNIKAEGKIELGKKFITDSNLRPEEILLVGDTIHDLEVANEIGCSVLLFSQGHNSNNQLSGYSVQIISDLMEVAQYLQH